MSEKRVYEIAKKLGDKDNLEKDMQEALGLVVGHFKSKYMERLQSAFDKCQENSINNPSKELRLIQAIRPFVPGERHDKLKDMEKMLTVMSTFENIRAEAVQIQEQTDEQGKQQDSKADTAIHEDGIYEIDQQCLMNKRKGIFPEVAGLMLVMSLMEGAGHKNNHEVFIDKANNKGDF